MIVVDANVVVYLVMRVTSFTDAALAAAERDADWHLPAFWKVEVANALLGLMRRRQATKKAIIEAWTTVDALDVKEHPVSDRDILPFALPLNLSAYDARYVRLARQLGCPLITADKALIANAAPHAVALTAFAAGEPLPRLPY